MIDIREGLIERIEELALIYDKLRIERDKIDTLIKDKERILKAYQIVYQGYDGVIE